MKLLTTLATLHVVMGSGILGDLNTHVHHAVQATKETADAAVTTIKDHASKIPLRKHHVRD